MQPVKNISTQFLDVGDIWQGQRVVELIPCKEGRFCRDFYLNFEISCGGYRRRLANSITEHGQEPCCFFPVQNKYLSTERDGRPIE